MRRGTPGFTLLEVMVAVAVLAVTFTAILTSEAGAIRMAARAQRMGAANLLARCKMGEIEELVGDEGLPAISKTGSDGCCEDAEIEGYRCDWEINTIELPDTMFAPEDEEGFSDEEGSDAPPGDAVAVPLGALDPEEALTSGMMGGFGAMALEMGMPILKPYFENQVRSAVVQVHWSEGEADRHIQIVQYLVANEGVAPGVVEGAIDDAVEAAGGGT